MGKAFQGEAVVPLPRALNNADHGRLLLARRVKSFQAVHQFFNVTYCITAGWIRIHVKTLILFLSIRLLKRFHAIFGIAPGNIYPHKGVGKTVIDLTRIRVIIRSALFGPHNSDVQQNWRFPDHTPPRFHG